MTYIIIREIFLFKNHGENEAGKLVPDLLLKRLYTRLIKFVCSLISMHFDSAQLGIQ